MQVTLTQPYKGYTTGTLTGNTSGYKKEVQLPSGLCLWLYEDEYTNS